MFREKEANAYIEKIFSGQFEPQTDEEKGAFERLNQVTAEMNKAQQEATAMAKRAEELRALANKLAGKREAYIEMLVNIEVKRHATDPKPLSLEEFRKQTGAEAVEAYDEHGKLIETTEETDDTDDRKPRGTDQETPGESQSPRIVPPRN